MSEDAWQYSKGFRSFWSLISERLSKMWSKFTILGFFGRFGQKNENGKNGQKFFKKKRFLAKTGLKYLNWLLTSLWVILNRRLVISTKKYSVDQFSVKKSVFWLKTPFTMPNPSWIFFWYELHCILIYQCSENNIWVGD